MARDENQLYFCRSCNKKFVYHDEGYSTTRELPSGGSAMIYACSDECAKFIAAKNGKGCIIHRRDNVSYVIQQKWAAACLA